MTQKMITMRRNDSMEKLSDDLLKMWRMWNEETHVDVGSGCTEIITPYEESNLVLDCETIMRRNARLREKQK